MKASTVQRLAPRLCAIVSACIRAGKKDSSDRYSYFDCSGLFVVEILCCGLLQNTLNFPPFFFSILFALCYRHLAWLRAWVGFGLLLADWLVDWLTHCLLLFSMRSWSIKYIIKKETTMKITANKRETIEWHEMVMLKQQKGSDTLEIVSFEMKRSRRSRKKHTKK